MPLRSAVHAGKAPAARAEAPRLRRTGPLPAMPPPRCQLCPLPAALLRPRCGTPLCRDCFVLRFEAEFLGSITPVPGSRVPVPAPGSTVAVAASGGKDSTVLSHLLQRFGLRLGLRLALVSVDEGIAGYREAALAAVREGRGGAPLLVLSHRDVFGWSVDELGAALGAGSRCTFCGVLRRQALERAARLLGADWIATGHNADDIAETLLMNFLRGDVARLRRTASEGGAGPTESPPETSRSTKSPMDTTKDPTDTAKHPMKTSKDPMKTSKGPTDTPKDPMKTSKDPPDTPKDPMKTSKDPIDTPRDPIDTLLSFMGFLSSPDPIKTTSGPIETTPGPIETSSGPTEATPGPIETSSGPIETSSGPTEATPGPIETSSGPTEATPGPIETSSGPIETTPGPIETSSGPTDATPGPKETSSGPTEATPGPIETSSGPTDATPGPIETSSGPIETRSGPPRKAPPVPAPWPPVPRCKPLRHACEKEIVLYAHFRRLRYVSTECAYAARAFRGHARALLKGLEAARAAAVPALGHSGRRLPVAGDARAPRRPLCACARCGFASSQGLCKACVLQGALQSGRPRVALGKRAMEEVMGRAWGPGDGAGGGCGCGAGGRGADGYGGRKGYGDGGHKGCGDGGHRGDGYGDHKGYGDGGCGDGGHRGDGYGGHKGYGDGGYGDGIHRGNEHKDGGCSCRAGGHKVDGYAAGDHKGDGYGAVGHGGRGGNGECACRARGHGAGVREAVDPRAGVEVEVVGAGGRSVRKRVVGLGRARGALNIWDF